MTDAADVDHLLAPLPSGRHGLTREQVTRSQRLRLLHAAIGVAGTHGYAAMTVSSVIARASVSRKTFYEQFADREHCFLAACEVALQQALLGARRACAGDGTWPERVRSALSWALESLAARPIEARVAFVEVPTAGPRALALRDRALRELAALLSPGFDAAPAGAAIPPSMPLAVAGALVELIGMRVRRDELEHLPMLVPELLFCTLAPFLGPVAAAAAAAERPTDALVTGPASR